MKIFVTGGSGYIGSLLCSSLVEDGFDVTLLSRRENSSASAPTVVGDLTADIERLSEFVAESDVIYHCAGELLDKSMMYNLHVRGTANLLAAVSEKIRRTRKAVHWVQLSSTGAYGGYRQTKIEKYVSEDDDPDPIGVYETTKTISDELVRSFALIEPLFTYTIVRPSIVIGLTMPNQSFWDMARFIHKGKFFYIGSNESIATYVHVDDVVGALLLCGVDQRAKNQTFIISNDCLFVDLINAISSASAVRRPLFRFPEKPLRFMIKLLSPFIQLPLTYERIDAIANRTGFSSSHVINTLEFKYKSRIPEIIPDLMAGLDRKRGTSCPGGHS